MKKIMIVGIALLLLATGTAAARNQFGIGLYGNLMGNGTGAGGGLGLTLRFGTFPVIGLEWNFVNQMSTIGGSLDWWFWNPAIVEAFSFYIGAGGYASVTTINPVSTLNIGARLPLGLQFFPIDPLEIFLEGTPMITFLPGINWAVSVRIGFRVLF
jgi:hypothetical protein